MARVTFYGAVEGVTGSAHLLQANGANILLDCGLFQGRREEEAANKEPFPFDVSTLDAVVLSHAHLDHSGRIPLLIKQGYEGFVHMTWPTVDLLEVLLKDAAALQERDTEWENKRRKRAGKDLLEPLYTAEDVYQALGYLSGQPYNEKITIAPGVRVRFLDAGHILGSSIVEVFIDEQGHEKKLVFSGDLGNSNIALLRDPATVSEADVVLMESTYGDRNHKSLDETLAEFEKIMLEASANGGNILIPSFAVGRTQEIIFRLGELFQSGKIKHQAVYLDSPMAIAVTEIYHRYQRFYNAEDKAAMNQTPDQKSLHNFLPVLRYSCTTEESMALNRIASGAIIIAGSGMCNGGRIRHHLKHNLWRKNAHVVIVGYQAMGTPGRALVDGAKTFKVAGEEVAVHARIHTLGGFSAHASQSQLADWLSHFEGKKPRLCLVHGESLAKQALQEFLQAKGWAPSIPSLGDTLDF